MENDWGRFRAVVIGVELISIGNSPPLGLVQDGNWKKMEMNESKERKFPFESAGHVQHKESSK